MGMILNTDFSTIDPSEGSRASFPVSDSKGWLCDIVESEGRETSNKKGRVLYIKWIGREGPVMGKFHEATINVANENAEAVRIGSQELSAIAHVTGHLRVGNSAEWHGKPMRLVIAIDEKNQDRYPGSVRIAGYRDTEGRKPSEAGQGALSAGGAAAGWGGAAAGAQTGQQQGNAAPAGNQVQGQQGFQQNAGAASGNAGFQQQGQQPNAGQQQAGGFQTGQFNPSQQGGQVVQQGGAQQFDPNAGQGQQQAGQFQQGQQQGQQTGFQQQGQGGAPNWA